MSPVGIARGDGHAGGFRHDALLYRGLEDFLDRTEAFIGDGVASGERVLVVVDAAKTELLRSRMDGGQDLVTFADMADVGRNPARIIPVWRAFVDEHTPRGRGVRGIGEPIWPGRSREELVECERHEALLNLAFSDAAWWLVCPYDLEALAPTVIAEARRNHPFVIGPGGRRASRAFRGLDEVGRPFDAPLEEPDDVELELTFAGTGEIAAIRSRIREVASRHGLSPRRVDDLVLAMGEVASNTLRHSGGPGTVRAWTSGDVLTCEVRDGGRIQDPLVGRSIPDAEQSRAYGMWLVNQVCDLVQVRTFPSGSVVRVQMTRP